MMSSKTIGLGLICLSTIGALGCSGDASLASPPAGSGASREATKPAEPVIAKDVTPAPFKSRFLRKLPAASEAETPVAYPPYDFSGTEQEKRGLEQQAVIRANTAESGWAAEPEPGRQRVIFTDLANREEWEHEFELADLQALWQLAREKGLNRPSAGGSVDGADSVAPGLTAPGATTQAWSNAVDSRVNKPINATYPITHNVLMRMGQINRGCTGTLVGRRLVLTAAHCVVNANLAQTNQQYRARGSGASEPFGVVNTAAYWWDAAYSANNCQNVYTIATRETCGRYDWALLLLPDNAWSGSPNGTPGWAGYWVPGEADMTNNAYARNDGYPGCGAADSPSVCVANTVYGETVGRTSVLFRGNDTSGVPAIFQTGNDINGGHSGSAIWSTVYPDANGPYVLAVVTNALCGTCSGFTGTTLTHPTMVRRITPWVGGFITTQRTNFP